MNLSILSELENKVFVCLLNKFKTFSITDAIHPDTKWVVYRLGQKVLKVKVTFVQTPSPYETFVFGQIQNS